MNIRFRFVGGFFPVLVILLIGLVVCHQHVQALKCNSREFLYGENEIVDELLTCSLSRSFDLDLTPQGDRIKPTSKTLVEQGLSNKTTIIHARLSGLWTAKRPQFIETGWKCDASNEGKIISTSIIELSSLALEVVEKLDIQLYRNQHKLAIHKPCKTFDLPTWMCRQSKPVYRTTTTWVNRAFFNLTLSQSNESGRPSIERLTPIFTCPETFKQKIAYSPSATYVISRHMQQLVSQPLTAAYQHTSSDLATSKPSGMRMRRQATGQRTIVEEPPEISHPSAFATFQSGKMPAAPPYHNSVKIIMRQVGVVLTKSLGDCLHIIDSDLSLVADHKSFSKDKYPADGGLEEARQDSMSKQTDESQANIKNECSSHSWIRSRIELANEASQLSSGAAPSSAPVVSAPQMSSSNLAVVGSSNNHAKRQQLLGEQLNYDAMNDPDQLLDPYGYYHQSQQLLPSNIWDRMIDDN